MSKHTPGPWSFDPLDRVIIKPEEADIAHMDSTASDADICLISAAPELLEALEALDNYYQSSGEDDFCRFYKDVLVPARAAIAKAKGEL